MRREWLIPLALVLGACQDVRPAVVPPRPTTQSFQMVPATEDDLLASLTVGLTGEGRSVQTLPASWDAASLRLEHATALSQATERTLLKDTDLLPNGTGGYVAAGAFGTRLRPAANYALTASLWNGGVGGTLVGEKRRTVNLVAGNNAVTLPIELYPSLGLSSFTPTSGQQGDAVTLSGQGFSVNPSLDQVSLGGAAASVTTASSVSLAVTVPDLGPGSYAWQVQVGSSLAARAGFSILGTIGARIPWVVHSQQQTDPAIVLGSDAYFAVWSDLQAGGKLAVFGGRLDLTGALQGSVFVVGSNGNVESEPCVAYNATSNQYLAAWNESFGGNRVRARIVNASGTLATGILDVVLDDSSLPQAGHSPSNNRYLVVWGDSRNATDDVYGQLVAANGTLVGGALALATGAGDQIRPALAYSSSAAKYLLVWEDQPGTGAYKIRGRIVNADGTLGAGPFDIGSGTSNQVEPAVAYDSVSGDFMVAWRSLQTPHNIRAQRVSVAGTLVGGALTLSNATGNKSLPRIAYESWRQKFVVVWGDLRSTNLDVYGQYVAPDGSLWGGNFVVGSGSGNQFVPDVAASATQQSGMVVYEDSTNSGDIYGQQIR